MLLLTTPSVFEAPAPPVATIERRSVDTIEIIYLSVIILVGTTLNLIVFIQLTRQVLLADFQTDPLFPYI